MAIGGVRMVAAGRVTSNGMVQAGCLDSAVVSSMKRHENELRLAVPSCLVGDMDREFQTEGG